MDELIEEMSRKRKSIVIRGKVRQNQKCTENSRRVKLITV
jgi:hypothetical protein